MKTFDVTIGHILDHYVGSKLGLYVSFLIPLYVDFLLKTMGFCQKVPTFAFQNIFSLLRII